MSTEIQKQKNRTMVETLPSVISDLISAQNNYDSKAYADAFAENAQVLDEGKTYSGRKEIQNWIDHANENFKTVMKPVEYEANQQLLKAEVSGNFPGSPLVLSYYFDIKEGEIHSLKITV